MLCACGKVSVKKAARTNHTLPTEFFNASEIRCTVDFASLRISVGPVAGSVWFVFPADGNVFGATAQTICFPQRGLRRFEVKRN